MICSGCALDIDVAKGHVPVETRMAGGRLTGTWHKACYKRRRQGLSGNTRNEPRSGERFFSDLGKR